jgi:hypothetical protein
MLVLLVLLEQSSSILVLTWLLSRECDMCGLYLDHLKYFEVLKAKPYYSAKPEWDSSPQALLKLGGFSVLLFFE